MAMTMMLSMDKLRLHTYDVIFMDLNMPDKDGIQTTREIRVLFPSNPCPPSQFSIFHPQIIVLSPECVVIGLTGDTDESRTEEAKKAGQAFVLQKPCNKEKVSEVLCRLQL